MWQDNTFKKINCVFFLLYGYHLPWIAWRSLAIIYTTGLIVKIEPEHNIKSC